MSVQVSKQSRHNLYLNAHCATSRRDSGMTSSSKNRVSEVFRSSNPHHITPRYTDDLNDLLNKWRHLPAHSASPLCCLSESLIDISTLSIVWTIECYKHPRTNRRKGLSQACRNLTTMTIAQQGAKLD
ncbi:hypothetical protein HOLleu_27722 [Holothuria leucospilota]|uniref:Uncharacterized protein n=1 Tax=Holothuria leucospilota TaxID=206669 RepID=A0A9Q1H2Z2_HOLLE|nr:hypothetical protein HOLleu_27722 [Holothuria leucospilota]